MNCWLGVGRVFHTPKLHGTETPTPRLRFSLSSAAIYDSGHEEVQIHTVVAFGDDARRWYGMIAKGDMVGVTGALKYHTTDRGGIRRRIAEIEASMVTLMLRAPVDG